MDFFNIIYRCLFNEYYTLNERIDFFVFEFHKAKSKGLSFDLFKREVLNELESMRRKIRIPLDKYMLELTLRKNELEREKDFDKVEKIKEEIRSLPYKKGKGLDLYKHSNSEFKGVIYYADIDMIENHLNDAYNQIINEPQPTINEPQPTIKEPQSKAKESQNLHDHIFANNGFELFNYILENYITTKRGRYADISFYYWKMYNNEPKYIHQRPEVFKEWFCGLYNESFEKIKTLGNVKDQKGNRERHYITSLDWFKQTD